MEEQAFDRNMTTMTSSAREVVIVTVQGDAWQLPPGSGFTPRASISRCAGSVMVVVVAFIVVLVVKLVTETVLVKVPVMVDSCVTVVGVVLLLVV